MYIIIHEPTGKRVLRSKKSLEHYAADKLLIEAAGGMVINQKGALLMIFRRGKWDLPKGKWDEGETLEQCALREVSEETGLTKLSLVRGLKTTYHTYSFHGKTVLKPTHWYLMHHHGKENFLPQTEEGITEIRWVHRKDAKRMIENTYPSIKEMVDAYFLI